MAELRTTRQRQSRAFPGLPKRNNQEQHSAILSAVEALPNGGETEMLRDSENTGFQLRGDRRVKDTALHALVRAVIASPYSRWTFAR
jgi:hypothetical protein